MALCGNRRAMVESRGFNGNRTAESRERTEDERTETTIPKQLCGLFKDGWKGMLSVSVNSVPLWFIIAAEKSILAVLRE